MKFLVKHQDSPILTRGLTYNKNNSHELRELLLEEQRRFCAYTEKRVDGHDATDVEHFDPALKKIGDDYYNYYAVLSAANKRKRGKQRKHQGARFFSTRFFQEPGGFARRIGYVLEDHVYEERDPEDAEACALIDYLGLNHSDLVNIRQKHVERLDGLIGSWSREKRMEYLRKYPQELSYITALEHHWELSLDELIAQRDPDPGW